MQEDIKKKFAEDLPKMIELGMVKPIYYCNKCNKELRDGVNKFNEYTLKDYKNYEKTGLCISCDEKAKKEISNDGAKLLISEYYGKRDLAERILKLIPMHYDKSKMWWIWNSYQFKWEVTDETHILKLISEISPANTVNSKEKAEILEALKQEARSNAPESIKPTWIQFKDLIYDIKTGEQFRASPKYFVTNPVPYELHPEHFRETPVMDRIFEEWVGKEYVQTLYEIIAYCLLPDYPIHRLFCLIGGGMNGKSCFLRLLGAFVGKDNVTSTELDTLLASRFEITKLHKKLVCIMGETNFNEMSKTSTLKKLTGQDAIGFEYKNKTPFDDINYAKIIIATNNLPTTSDKTIGFYRRWMIIDFPNRFSEQKDILSEIPEEEYSALALKCALILKDLLEERKFTNEGSIEDRQKRYEDKSDPLQKFMKLFILEDFGGFIWKYDFEKKFNEWCKENRFREYSDVAIGKKMKELGIETQTKHANWLNDGRGGQLRAWVGIRWKN